MDKFLGIYLNDQLAMGVLWRELARRTERNNRGTQAEKALAEVASEFRGPRTDGEAALRVAQRSTHAAGNSPVGDVWT